MAESPYVSIYPESDCMDVMPTLESESIHLVLTDPPYGMASVSHSDWPSGTPKQGVVGKLPVGMKFSKKQGGELQRFMYGVARQWFRLCRPGAFVLCFSQPRLSHRMALAIENAGFDIRDVYTWTYHKRTQMKAFGMDHFIQKKDIPWKDKVSMMDRIGGRKTAQLKPLGEHIVMAQKPCEGTLVDNYLKWGTGLVDVSEKLNDQVPHTVMHVEKHPYRLIHKETWEEAWITAKPMRLISHLIRVFSAEGDVVLDPFLGSGTTAESAFNAKRSCIGIELGEAQSSVIVKRMVHEHIPWRLCRCDQELHS